MITFLNIFTRNATHVIAPPLITVVHFISGDLWAGAEVMAWRLLEKLASCPDVALSVILCNQGRLHDNLVSLKVETILLDETKLSPFELVTQLLGYVRRKKPHVLHCHRYKENLLGYLAGRYAKVPALITTQHGMPEYFQGFAGIKNRIFSACNLTALKRYNAVVAVSADIGNALITRHGFHESKIRVIRNGVGMPQEVVRRSGVRDFVIGSAGRFVPVKDYDLMVRMAAEIVRHIPGVRFVLAGDGPGKMQLQATIEKLGLAERFELLGAIDDMENFYKGLDIYVNTSVHEGIPMTILEAMAHGVPVVACNVGGIGEIIEDGRNGFLVSSRDPRHLAEKCVSLRHDVTLWEKISVAARQRIETSFSDISMAQQYYTLYKKLLGKSHEK